MSSYIQTAINSILAIRGLKLSRQPQKSTTPAFTTTASCIWAPTGTCAHETSEVSAADAPTGVVPQLPIELICHIIGFADLHTLPALCLVNSTFQDATIPLIYEDIHPCKLSAIIGCLKTLRDSPNLAARTNGFMYCGCRYSGRESTSNLTTAFGVLLGKAMQNLSNLTCLSLQLLAPLGRHLRGAPFRLVYLDTTAEWDADFVAFLEEQTSISTFIHHGSYHSPFRVSPSALPNLSSIDSWPSVVEALLPHRPVKEIILLCAPRAVMEDAAAFEAIGHLGALSTGPLSSVYLVNGSPETNADEFFRIVSPMVDGFPDVTFLGFNTYVWDIDEVRSLCYSSCSPLLIFLLCSNPSRHSVNSWDGSGN